MKTSPRLIGRSCKRECNMQERVEGKQKVAPQTTPERDWKKGEGPTFSDGRLASLARNDEKTEKDIPHARGNGPIQTDVVGEKWSPIMQQMRRKDTEKKMQGNAGSINLEGGGGTIDQSSRNRG